MNRNKIRGFTLIELLAILAIIMIIAAIAVPSMVAYQEMGRQTSRTNVARTIYVAAQNRLVELRLSKNLREFSSEFYYADTEELKEDVGTVFGAGGIDIGDTDEDTENAEYVRYISKNGNEEPSGAILELLGDVINDTTILNKNNAILIEYNIKTGIVLSVFYTDEKNVVFGYYGEGNTSKGNVSGARPNYAYADKRRQGYYGVGQTGTLPPEFSRHSVVIKDGAQEPLEIVNNDGIVIASYTNVLYAEMFFAADQVKDGQEYVLQILKDSGDNPILFESEPISLLSVPDAAPIPIVLSAGVNPHILYKVPFKANPADEFDFDGYKIVWVLDYVAGDMTSQEHSIGVKYGVRVEPQDIRAGVRPNESGATAVSLSTAHSHFAYEAEDVDGKTYAITSVRHLNNVRYALDGNFMQMNDIEMQDVDEGGLGAGANFLPIGAAYDRYMATAGSDVKIAYGDGLNGTVNAGTFTGSYLARIRNAAEEDRERNYEINNLTVDMSALSAPGDNIGLFGELSGRDAGRTAKIVGLTLNNVKIAGGIGTNVGAIAGQIGEQGFSNAEVTICSVAGGTITAGQNGGGIVGVNYGKILSCYVANSQESKISVKYAAAPVNNIGGIAGFNGGKIEDVFLVSNHTASPIQDAASAGTKVGGIVGDNESGSLDRALYLAFAPKNADVPTKKDCPISGNTLGTIGADVYYLSSDRYSVDRGATWVDGEYNINAISVGIPESTWGLYNRDISAWQLWGKNASIDDVLVPESPYPYPYLMRLPIPLDWSIVEDTGRFAEMYYYEKYSDGSLGFWKPATVVLGAENSLKDDVAITEAGYAGLLYAKSSVANPSVSRNTLQYSPSAGVWEDFAGDQAKFDTDKANWFVRTDLNYIDSNDGLAYSAYIVPTKAPLISNPTVDPSKPALVRVARSGAEQFEQYMQPLFAKGIYDDDVLTNSAKTPEEFAIRTPQQMKNISALTMAAANVSNKTFNQELDLDFSVVAIGGGVKTTAVVEGEFRGIYEGEGGVINNLNISGEDGTGNLGLFGKNSGQVKELTLADSCQIKAKGDYTGGIAAQNTGGVIADCVNYATVENTKRYTGGITGYSDGSSQINDCSNNGAINGNGDYVGGIAGSSLTKFIYTGIVINSGNVTGLANYVGGVVGFCDGEIEGVLNSGNIAGGTYVGGVAGSTSAFVRECANSGEITGKTYVGGVAGEVSNASADVLDCVNYASVAGTGDYVGGIAGNSLALIEGGSNSGNVTGVNFIGGIVGFGEKTASIKDCNNYTKITGIYYVGGIAGRTEADTDSCENEGAVVGSLIVGGIAGSINRKVEECNNRGAITASATGYVQAYAGGIVGCTLNISDNGIFNCINYAEVKADGTCVGGIVGLTFYSTENCENYGAVSVTHTRDQTLVGGIVGDCRQNTSTIAGCKNYNTVTSAGGYVGGIAGNTLGKTTDCKNEGAVSGNKSYIGGIVGGAEEAINNCENKGAIKGIAFVGGIVGYRVSNSVTDMYVTDSKNYASVTGTSDYVGGIAGRCIDNVGTTTRKNVKGCENSGAVKGSARVGGIVGNINGRVEECNNNGAVTGGSVVQAMTGGIVGSTATTSTADNGVFDCNNFAVVKASGVYVGGIAGINNGSTENCNNYGAVSITSTDDQSYVGGIVGNSGKATSTIAGCKNYNTVTSAGGVVGGIAGNTYGKVTDCENEGAVKGDRSYIGGIAGYTEGAIGNCENDGVVWGKGARIGGIAGHTIANANVENCVNRGDVTNSEGVNAYNYIGGIVGYQDGKVTNAKNYGTVAGTASGNCAGGISGVAAKPINTCENYGVVTAGGNTGGIVGNCAAAINTCVNYSNVSGSHRVGGIAGENSAGITDCANEGGKVTGSLQYIGGVSGMGISVNAVIMNCSNIADVYGYSYSVGGIVGRIHNNNTTVVGKPGILAKVTDCWNTGYVEGYTYVGGIVGSLDQEAYAARNYSAADVKATYGNSGAIIGVVKSKRDDRVSECYRYDLAKVSGLVLSANAAESSMGAPLSKAALTAAGVPDNAPVYALAVSEGRSVNVEWSGTGTAGNPYKITNLDDLKRLNEYNLVNGISFSKVHFKMTGDIDANYDSKFVSGFTSKGGGDDAFCGILDGGGSTIRNLKINRGSTAYIGLFGFVNYGKISGITLENSDIKGTDYTGGLVGYANFTDIEECYNNSGVIKGGMYAGGIVGFSNGNLTKCVNRASVSGGSHVGGVVGRILSDATNNGRSTTDKCGNAGFVEGGQYIGGIAGSVVSCRIINSYDTGNVTGKSYIGGIAGYSAASYYTNLVEGCYVAADIGGTYGAYTSGDVGAIIGASYQSSELLVEKGYLKNNYRYELSKVCGKMLNTDAPDSSMGGMLSQAGFATAGLDSPVFHDGRIDSRIAIGSGGTGTKEDPYKISNAADFKQIIDLCQADDITGGTVGGISFCAVFFEQTANISLAGYTQPNFGGSDKAFSGAYDGGGFEISDVNINKPTQDYVGVFGYLYGANINNVHIVDSVIIGRSNVGALAGRAYTSKLFNCSSSASVTGVDRVGGLIGVSTDYVTVSDSHNTGDVNGNLYVGGIIGRTNTETKLTKCYNAGSIAGKDSVGGIAGDHAGTLSLSFSNCLNLGMVARTSGDAANFGGILGSGTSTITITRCINLVEMAVGKPITTAVSANIDCYYLADYSDVWNEIVEIVVVEDGEDEDGDGEPETTTIVTYERANNGGVTEAEFREFSTLDFVDWVGRGWETAWNSEGTGGYPYPWLKDLPMPPLPAP